MAREGFEFSYRLRVRYAEVDGQNIVFNSRYLEYADLEEYWRWLGLDQMVEARGMDFRVARASVDYKLPFRHRDEIVCWARTDRIGTSSVTIRIELCDAATGALHTVIELVRVKVDLANSKAVPVPDAVRARMMPAD